MYLRDPDTFVVTNLTPKQAAAELRNLYYSVYPARFRMPARFGTDQIPVAIARTKAKGDVTGNGRDDANYAYHGLPGQCRIQGFRRDVFLAKAGPAERLQLLMP